MANRKSCKCQHCRKAFQPVKSSQRHCSNACRQAAYRRRKNQPLEARRRAKKGAGERALIPTTCAHCGGRFWARRRSAVYCSTSCRTLAHRARRQAAVEALAALHHLPQDQVNDLADLYGTKRLTGILKAQGWQYDPHIRRWL
jgi:hypothetical protein